MWKQALILLWAKKAVFDASILSNYRLISLLLNVSKVLERLVNSQLMHFFFKVITCWTLPK